jgi:hypothetical protein
MNFSAYSGGVPLLLLFLALPVLAGTDPRAKPADYAHQAPLSSGAVLAADFHGRGVPSAGPSAPPDGVLLRNYLVFEVAFFPPRGEKIRIASGQFRLQIDGKRAVPASSAGEVAMALRLGDSEDPQVVSTVQVGPAVVGVDPRPREERFPGDPMPGGRPRAPRSPTVEPAEKPAIAPDQYLKEAALEEGGEDRGVRAGMIYFRWKDKITKAKSITLLFDGPGGPATLRVK